MSEFTIDAMGHPIIDPDLEIRTKALECASRTDIRPMDTNGWTTTEVLNRAEIFAEWIKTGQMP